jgi:hypothetical protein
MIKILTEHITRYPMLKIQDLYKLVYQASMGCGHAVNDIKKAEKMLDREIMSMKTAAKEPAIDQISPDGYIVRVHLHPYLRTKKGDKHSLFEAFIKSAKEFRGSEKKLVEYWREMEILAERNILPFNTSEIQDFFNKMQEKGFPPVHHSKIYRETYHPAYRVIVKKFLDENQ